MERHRHFAAGAACLLALSSLPFAPKLLPASRSGGPGRRSSSFPPPCQGQEDTIYAPRWISVAEAYRLFLGALDSLGLTVEPQGKFLRLVETTRARMVGLPLFLPGEHAKAPDKSYATRLFRF
jgi:hypothetical protein